MRATARFVPFAGAATWRACGISKIIDHLGLSPPETAKPPPALHEVVRVPVDEQGREIEAP